jgi:RNA polymerase sigma-70 factor, ECF subfamily
MDASNAKISKMSDKTSMTNGKALDDSSRTTRIGIVEIGSTANEDKLAAFLRLVEERRSQLMWMAQRMTKNPEDAEDVVQEALLRAYKNLARFRGESKMGTWLCVIVQNVGRERLRKQKGKIFLPLEGPSNGDENPIAYEFPDPGRNPEQHCESREFESILVSEIDRMNSICKRTIQMCTLEEFSHDEVANALGVNVLTVKSRLFNGRRMLQRAVCLRAGIQIASAQSPRVAI